MTLPLSSLIVPVEVLCDPRLRLEVRLLDEYEDDEGVDSAALDTSLQRQLSFRYFHFAWILQVGRCLALWRFHRLILEQFNQLENVRSSHLPECVCCSVCVCVYACVYACALTKAKRKAETRIHHLFA